MEEIKNNEDKNIQRLREEFNQRQNCNENYPKTSHGIKHSINQNINNSNSINNHSQKYHSYNKVLSANKYKSNIKSNHYFQNSIDKNHPGYLYYKEALKYTKYIKKRTFTGKTYNRKFKLEPIPKQKNKNKYERFNHYNNNFPKIINGKKNTNILNERHTYFNNKFEKNNPYFPFWADKILNKNDFRIEIKKIAYGVPQLSSINRKNDFVLKILNKDKEIHYNNSKKNLVDTNNKLNTKNVYYNNFIDKNNKKKTNIQNNKNTNNKNNIINKNNLIEDIKKENIYNFDIENKNKIENKENELNKEDNNNNEDNEGFDNFDEEKEKLFYTNQKNFFKARKDIIEEPEYLEEDNENNDKIEEEK